MNLSWQTWARLQMENPHCPWNDIIFLLWSFWVNESTWARACQPEYIESRLIEARMLLLTVPASRLMKRKQTVRGNDITAWEHQQSIRRKWKWIYWNMTDVINGAMCLIWPCSSEKSQMRWARQRLETDVCVAGHQAADPEVIQSYTKKVSSKRVQRRAGKNPVTVCIAHFSWICISSNTTWEKKPPISVLLVNNTASIIQMKSISPKFIILKAVIFRAVQIVFQ